MLAHLFLTVGYTQFIPIPLLIWWTIREVGGWCLKVSFHHSLIFTCFDILTVPQGCPCPNKCHWRSVSQGCPCPGVTYPWAAVLKDCTLSIMEHPFQECTFSRIPNNVSSILVPPGLRLLFLKHSRAVAVEFLWLTAVLVHNESWMSEPARTGCDQPVHGSSWSPSTPITTAALYQNPDRHTKYNSTAISDQYNVMSSTLKAFNMIHCILSSTEDSLWNFLNTLMWLNILYLF